MALSLFEETICCREGRLATLFGVSIPLGRLFLCMCQAGHLGLLDLQSADPATAVSEASAPRNWIRVRQRVHGSTIASEPKKCQTYTRVFKKRKVFATGHFPVRHKRKQLVGSTLPSTASSTQTCREDTMRLTRIGFASRIPQVSQSPAPVLTPSAGCGHERLKREALTRPTGTTPLSPSTETCRTATLCVVNHPLEKD